MNLQSEHLQMLWLKIPCTPTGVMQGLYLHLNNLIAAAMICRVPELKATPSDKLI